MEKSYYGHMLQYHPVIIEALMQTWSNERLEEFKDTDPWGLGIIAARVLKYRNRAKKPTGHRLNYPIDEVLDDYLCRRRGKFAEAKRQLKKRFDGLEHSMQEKVMMAFIEQGNKADREFIYGKLYGEDFWVDDYIPLVQKWWEEFHDGKMSKVVVKYCPREYILAHLDELEDWCNYATLCLRTGIKPDPKRLPSWTYLYVLKTNGGQMRFREGEEVVFQWVRKYLYEEASDKPVCSIYDIPYVRRMLAYLGEMGRVCDIMAIDAFDRRMQNVHRTEWGKAVIEALEAEFGFPPFVYDEVK